MKWPRYWRVISLKIQVGIRSHMNKWANTNPRKYWRLDQVPRRSKHPLPTGRTRREPSSSDLFVFDLMAIRSRHMNCKAHRSLSFSWHVIEKKILLPDLNIASKQQQPKKRANGLHCLPKSYWPITKDFPFNRNLIPFEWFELTRFSQI